MNKRFAKMVVFFSAILTGVLFLIIVMAIILAVF